MATTPGAGGFTITDFKAGISKSGLEPARSSLFKFGMSGGPASTLSTAFSNIEFLCRATSLPGLTITPIERQYLGRTVKIPGDMTFAELAVTLVNDTGYGLRNAFEVWMAGINSHEENKRHLGSAFGAECATLTLSVLDPAGSVANQAYSFVNAWPTTIDPIELSWDTASDIEEFGVTFAYQYFRVS